MTDRVKILHEEEDGRSTRNFRDAMSMRAHRAEVMIDLPLTAAVATRSRDIQLALTQRGQFPGL